jgi:hypothetical protein
MMASPDKPLAAGTEARVYNRMSDREIDARLAYFAKADVTLPVAKP